MKLTKKQIELIKKLKETLTPKELSIKLNITYSTVLYYYDPKNKARKIKYQLNYQKINKPKRTDKLREYQRIYQNKRYWRLKNSIENAKEEKK